MREALGSGDPALAAQLTIDALGAEVLGFLFARQTSRTEAEDAFSLACERLWRTLAQFDWQCSLRTWVYRLARNAAVDVIRQRGAVGRGAVPLSQAPELQDLAGRIRTATASHYASDRKREVLALREQLSDEDRELLTLRFEREWPGKTSPRSSAVPWHPTSERGKPRASGNALS